MNIFISLFVSIFTARFSEGRGWKRGYNLFIYLFVLPIYGLDIRHPWPQSQSQEHMVTTVSGFLHEATLLHGASLVSTDTGLQHSSGWLLASGTLLSLQKNPQPAASLLTLHVIPRGGKSASSREPWLLLGCFWIVPFQRGRKAPPKVKYIYTHSESNYSG